MAGRTGLARKAAEAANGARWCLGDAYEPHLRAQDVRSRGRKSRHTYQGREMHFLSDLEVRACVHFQWDQAVFGIEEQYYLEIEDTVRIAKEAGARHPLVIGTDEPFEMTTDLVIYFRTEHGERRVARSIKYSKEVELGLAETAVERNHVAGVLEKLEIERRYWAERNVHWAVLTERELGEERQRNVEWLLRSSLDRGRPDGFWQQAADRVCAALVAGDGARVVDLQRELDANGVLDGADFTEILRHLCATRQISFDMKERFSLLRPVSDFVFAAPALKLVG
jgi:hypothetical protein